MKALIPAPVKLLQDSRFCLFTIAVGLTMLHLLLILRVSRDIDQLIISVIFWGALLCLVWRKRDTLNLESGIFSSFFGLLLLALVFLKSFSLFYSESAFLKIFPLIAALSVSLLASGIKGIKQYWRELIIVLLLCLPASLITQTINELFHVTTLTTQFAVFILWYLGFAVSRQDTALILSNSSASVSTDCTGIGIALLLLKLGVIYILMFSPNWSKKILLLVGALFIAFVVGGIRVAIISVFVSNQEAFNYWHGGAGNQIFTTVSILIFSLFCNVMRSPDKLASSGSVELRSP